MKLIVLRGNFLDALNSVEKAVGGSSHLPILKNILVEAGEKILITSTNLEFGVRYTLPGKIIERGSVTIPFSLIAGIVRNLNSERITLETKDTKIIVSAENYEALIQGQDAKDFPIIPTIQNKEYSFTLNAGVLRHILEKVIIAAQYSDIRPEISGIFFRYFDGTISFVATDSFRLAEYTAQNNQFQTNFMEVSAIIPLKTAQEILRILSDDDEAPITIFIDPSQILFTTDIQEVISRLIDGTFPDYRAIIPRETVQEIIIQKSELMSAIKLVSSFSGRAQDITLKAPENKKLLELYCGEASAGENHYRVPAKINGGAFSIVFNWRYLFDGLRACDGDEIVLGMNGAQKPATVTCAQDPSFLYVVMPIKG